MKILLAGLFALVAPAGAGPTYLLTLDDLAKAPALVVATVESVRETGARLRVLRTFPADVATAGDLVPIDRPTDTFVELAPGTTAVFPLRPEAGGTWRLIGDGAMNRTVPALPAASTAQLGPPGKREFLLAELAKALANGSTKDRYAASRFLISQRELPADLQAIMESMVGSNEDQWLEVACALLASRPVPQRPVSELMAGLGTAGDATAWALAKGAKRDYPNRLIAALLRNMGEYEWGAGNALLEFRDTPLVVREMSKALAAGEAPAMAIAGTMIRNGARGFLPEALAAAARLVRAPVPVDSNRLGAASEIIRDYGTDAQFAVLPATLRRLKAKDQALYGKLYGTAKSFQNRRELQLAAILLDDRRVYFGSYRYCDVAAEHVGRFAGDSFGIRLNDNMTVAQWDKAVAKATAWLQAHPAGL